MTTEEKKAAILAEIAKVGVTDLESLASEMMRRLPEDWDPESEYSIIIGPWYIFEEMLA